VKNATLTEVEGVIGDIDLFASALFADFSKLDKLRTSLKNAQVTSYAYKQLYGITSKTDSRGITTYYEYDNFQRLVSIKENSNKIIESYYYKFKR
jgi:YD repeat-containing protein